MQLFEFTQLLSAQFVRAFIIVTEFKLRIRGVLKMD